MLGTQTQISKQGATMEKEIVCSSAMLQGRKCDYSKRFFYIKGGYIFSKKTDRIVDILARSAVYGGN